MKALVKKSTRINFGNTYLKSMLCEVAWCMVRSKNTYLSKFYWGLKPRRGAKKAIIAVARKILVIIYHMLKNDEVYNENKFTIAKEKQVQRQRRNVIAKAKKLGLQLTEPRQTSVQQLQQILDPYSA